MILLGCLVTIFIIIFWLHYIINIPKQVNLEFKNIESKRKQIEIKLNDKLLQLCEMLNIPVSYENDLGDVAGKILYHSMGGRLLLDNCKIEILNKYKNEPYVLAHEIGHYISIKSKQDKSEEMADKMANELCCMLLSEQEQKDLEISLQCHFHVN